MGGGGWRGRVAAARMPVRVQQACCGPAGGAGTAGAPGRKGARARTRAGAAVGGRVVQRRARCNAERPRGGPPRDTSGSRRQGCTVRRICCAAHRQSKSETATEGAQRAVWLRVGWAAGAPKVVRRRPRPETRARVATATATPSRPEEVCSHARHSLRLAAMKGECRIHQGHVNLVAGCNVRGPRPCARQVAARRRSGSLGTTP